MSAAGLRVVPGSSAAPSSPSTPGTAGAAEGTPWMTEREAAEYMRFTVPALRSARYEHRGPAFSKVGRAIRYHRADLDAFLSAGRRSA